MMIFFAWDFFGVKLRRNKVEIFHVILCKYILFLGLLAKIGRIDKLVIASTRPRFLIFGVLP